MERIHIHFISGIDSYRSPCLGAGQKTRGLWERDWLALLTFSSPEPTILLACGRNRELWEQPFWNNKGNNRSLPIRFKSVFIYGACPKWLLPEISIPAAGKKDRRLWGRECFINCQSRMHTNFPKCVIVYVHFKKCLRMCFSACDVQVSHILVWLYHATWLELFCLKINKSIPSLFVPFPRSLAYWETVRKRL